jgi:hypothetical protein
MQMNKKLKKLTLVFVTFGISSLHSYVACAQSVSQLGAGLVKPLLGSDAPDWLKRTDISGEGIERGKPTFAIETVQPLYQTPKTLRDTIFFQGRLAHRNSDSTLNLGLGYRHLLEDKTWLLGVNSFFDTTTKSDHQRIGVGAEAIGQFITFRTNYYNAISGVKTVSTVNGATTTEHALDGYDYELETPIPYAPWLRFAATGFHFSAATSGYPDLKGEKYSLIGNLTRNIYLEIGSTDDNYRSSQNFIKLTWNVGGAPSSGTKDSLFGGAKQVLGTAFQARDLSKHTLDKVRRQNDMVVERKSGGIVIARKD